MTRKKSTTGVEGSQQGHHYGKRGGRAGCGGQYNGRGGYHGGGYHGGGYHGGGYHGGGHWQGPPHPAQAPGNAMTYPPIVHYGPPSPPAYGASYPYGHYPSPHSVPTGQYPWNQSLPTGSTQNSSLNNVNGEEGGKKRRGRRKPNRSHQADAQVVTRAEADQGSSTDSRDVSPPEPDLSDGYEPLCPLFNYFRYAITVERIHGTYKDRHTNETLHFDAWMKRSEVTGETSINAARPEPLGEQVQSFGRFIISFDDSLDGSVDGSVVADAGDTTDKTPATEPGAGSSVKGPDSNSSGSGQ
ncbi:hypothetical protein DER46DRAFT_674937 [Fusarium sp. MPI-SDFR-AT-0072]|nr:hypothetical protein DER46DRAFT_674937 [Fusarium sp. MPI-SDFR-AT-0072]